ncbi:MAG: glycoside hydrolase family 3 protein, partial [Bacteroidales bacterium]|nr:glycoside hydrolase family 3 protein [Bacteroidales bacterium]
MRFANLLIGVAVCCSHAVSLTAQVKLNASNIDDVISQMTLEEKVRMLIGRGMAMGPDVKFPGTAGSTYAIPRLRIPSVYMADGPFGVRMNAQREYDSHNYYTTEFPSGITVASSWDVDVAYAIGKAIGIEIKEYGLDILLAPGVNIHRNVLCGRNHEYYSEDPVITGKIATAYINGVQSTGAGTSIKHFMANNQESNRNANDSRVSQRALREIYLKGFEIAIKESRPWTVMTAYNKLNGLYTCENVELTETILRDEWGYEGLVISDWNAGTDAVVSMKAGNDMMQPGQDRQYETILKAVQNGELSESIIDRNVKRVLEMVVKSLSFAGYNYSNEPDLKSHARLDRETAAEGMVLLRNNRDALPFGDHVKNVALYGASSYDIIPGGVGFGGTGTGRYTVSLIEGLRKAGYTVDKDMLGRYRKHLADEEKRLFPNGRPPFSLRPPARAAEMVHSTEELNNEAKNNDLAIITIGRTSGEVTDRTEAEFNLTAAETELIVSVSKAYRSVGKNIVVILNICSPIETASWKDQADAILCAWQPGEQAGNSMVDILSGKVNPSGKLPMTFPVSYGDSPSDLNFPSNYEPQGFGYGPRNDDGLKELVKDIDYTNYEEGIYVGYRYFDTFNKQVSYPFGFGLSYTTFEYEVV